MWFFLIQKNCIPQTAHLDTTTTILFKNLYPMNLERNLNRFKLLFIIATFEI